MRHPAVIAVGLAVAFFTLQAAYWPITVHAGTPLHFWQLHWAAEIGYRVGAPVVGLRTGRGIVDNRHPLGITVADAVKLIAQHTGQTIDTINRCVHNITFISQQG